MTTQTDLSAARAERQRIVDQKEAAARAAREEEERLAELNRQIAEGEVEERARRFEGEVEDIDDLAASAKQALDGLTAALDGALTYLAGLDTEALARALKAAQNAESVHDQWLDGARHHAQRDAEKDAAALKARDPKAFVLHQRKARGARLKRVVGIDGVIDAWLNQTKPGTPEAFKRAVILALVVDLRYLEMWNLPEVARKRAQYDMHQPGAKQRWEMEQKRKALAAKAGVPYQDERDA